jgi:AraC-like DNA-binding protein
MPHVSGVLPDSILYLHLPSEFARKTLLYAVYFGRYFCDARYMFKRNNFDYYGCHIIDHGTLYVLIDGKEYAVPERSIYLYDGRKPVCIYTKGKMTHRHFTIGGQAASALCDRIISTSGNIIESYDHIVVDEAFNRIIGLAGDGCQNEARISAQLQVILGELLSPDSRSSSLPSRAIARAVQFMESHFADNLSVKDIVTAAAFYSEHYFSQIFKEAMHLSPHAYLRKLQLTFAIELLSNTTLTIEEIAKKCGFASAQNFIICFKQQYGRSPGQYRKGAART